MPAPVNPSLNKKTKQWTVQRIRTKQGRIVRDGDRIHRGKGPCSEVKRKAYRRYAHRTGFNAEYVRCSSLQMA
jgi:hypothetical protein